MCKLQHLASLHDTAKLPTSYTNALFRVPPWVLGTTIVPSIKGSSKQGICSIRDIVFTI